MKYWEEPLDHKGSTTYSIDFSKEMLALGETLSNVTIELSSKSIAAGLVYTVPTITNNVFTTKFSIPDVNKQIFSKKGQPLDMRVTYVSSLGEKDAETFVLLVKDK